MVPDHLPITAAMPLPTLREFQSCGIDKLSAYMDTHRDNYDGYCRSIVLVNPTGGGKTEMALFVILNALIEGRRSLFIVDDVSLVGQTRDRFARYGHRPGMIAASIGRNTDPSHPVQIASIGTLCNRDIPQGIKLVIIDECHQCGFSATQRWWADKNEDGTWKHWDKDCWVIGLTASPWRTKKTEALDELYGHMIVVAQPSELIEIGRQTDFSQGLVPPEYYGFRKILDFSEVKKQGGDFQQGSLAVVVDTDEVIDNIFKQWLTLCYRGTLKASMRTLYFGTGVGNAERVAARFNRGLKDIAIAEKYFDGLAEFDAEFPWRRHEPGDSLITWKKLEGDDDLKEREYWFRRMQQGYLVGLTCADVLTKGFDLPEIECVWPRPTESLVIKTQQEGRAARCAPWISKRQFLIVDIGLNCMKPKLGRFDDEQPYSINKRPAKNKPDEAPMKECPECHKLLYAFQMVCECGHKFEVKAEKGIAGGNLVKLLTKTERTFQLKYRRYAAKAYSTGEPPSWALLKVQEDMGRDIAVEDIEVDQLIKVRAEWLVSGNKIRAAVVTPRITEVVGRKPSGAYEVDTKMGRCLIPAMLKTVRLVPDAVPAAMIGAYPWRSDRKDIAPATEKEMAQYWLYLGRLAKKKNKDEAWCRVWYDAEFGASAKNPALLNFGHLSPVCGRSS